MIYIYIFALLFATQIMMQMKTQIERVEQSQIVEFKYLQYYDVRNNENEFENLRITYDICELINETQSSKLKCREFAYNVATSIDA